jgi:hypothetical protein
MKKLVSEVAKGVTTEQAILKAYGSSLEKLHEEWRTWGRRNY